MRRYQPHARLAPNSRPSATSDATAVAATIHRPTNSRAHQQPPAQRITPDTRAGATAAGKGVAPRPPPPASTSSVLSLLSRRELGDRVFRSGPNSRGLPRIPHRLATRMSELMAGAPGASSCVFLGFSRCGGYLLSYSFDEQLRFELQAWRYRPGAPLRLHITCPLFPNADWSQCSVMGGLVDGSAVRLSVWEPDDSGCIVVTAFLRERSPGRLPTPYYITILPGLGSHPAGGSLYSDSCVIADSQGAWGPGVMHGAGGGGAALWSPNDTVSLFDVGYWVTHGAGGGRTALWGHNDAVPLLDVDDEEEGVGGRASAGFQMPGEPENSNAGVRPVDWAAVEAAEERSNSWQPAAAPAAPVDRGLSAVNAVHYSVVVQAPYPYPSVIGLEPVHPLPAQQPLCSRFDRGGLLLPAEEGWLPAPPCHSHTYRLLLNSGDTLRALTFSVRPLGALPAAAGAAAAAVASVVAGGECGPGANTVAPLSSGASLHVCESCSITATPAVAAPSSPQAPCPPWFSDYSVAAAAQTYATLADAGIAAAFAGVSEAGARGRAATGALALAATARSSSAAVRRGSRPDSSASVSAAPAPRATHTVSALGVAMVVLPALLALPPTDPRAQLGSVSIRSCVSIDYEKLLSVAVKGRISNYDARLVVLQDGNSERKAGAGGPHGGFGGSGGGRGEGEASSTPAAEDGESSDSAMGAAAGEGETMRGAWPAMRAAAAAAPPPIAHHPSAAVASSAPAAVSSSSAPITIVNAAGSGGTGSTSSSAAGSGTHTGAAGAASARFAIIAVLLDHRYDTPAAVRELQEQQQLQRHGAPLHDGGEGIISPGEAADASGQLGTGPPSHSQPHPVGPLGDDCRVECNGAAPAQSQDDSDVRAKAEVRNCDASAQFYPASFGGGFAALVCDASMPNATPVASSDIEAHDCTPETGASSEGSGGKTGSLHLPQYHTGQSSGSSSCIRSGVDVGATAPRLVPAKRQHAATAPHTIPPTIRRGTADAVVVDATVSPPTIPPPSAAWPLHASAPTYPVAAAVNSARNGDARNGIGTWTRKVPLTSYSSVAGGVGGGRRSALSSGASWDDVVLDDNTSSNRAAHDTTTSNRAAYDIRSPRAPAAAAAAVRPAGATASLATRRGSRPVSSAPLAAAAAYQAGTGPPNSRAAEEGFLATEGVMSAPFAASQPLSSASQAAGPAPRSGGSSQGQAQALISARDEFDPCADDELGSCSTAPALSADSAPAAAAGATISRSSSSSSGSRVAFSHTVALPAVTAHSQPTAAPKALVANVAPAVRTQAVFCIDLANGAARLVQLGKVPAQQQPAFDARHAEGGAARGGGPHRSNSGGGGGGEEGWEEGARSVASRVLTSLTTALVNSLRAAQPLRPAAAFTRELNNDAVLRGVSLSRLLHPSLPAAIVTE